MEIKYQFGKCEFELFGQVAPSKQMSNYFIEDLEKLENISK